MSLFSQLLGIAALGGFFACILFVAFGQITVRKLRKNPATKERLGVEFASGWDILNVAGALSTPGWLKDKFNRSSLSFLIADHDALYKNTHLFDRILARVFWLFYTTSSAAMILLVILKAFGIFD